MRLSSKATSPAESEAIRQKREREAQYKQVVADREVRAVREHVARPTGGWRAKRSRTQDRSNAQ